MLVSRCVLAVLLILAGVHPAGCALGRSCDDLRLPLQVINGRGQQIMLGYDASERLTGVSFPSGGAANLSFYYNTDDSLSSFTDGLGTTSVSYDPAGRVQSVTYNYAAIPANTLNYAYNPDGSRASMTWTSGVNTVGTWYYGYDQAGRLTSVRNLGFPRNSGD